MDSVVTLICNPASPRLDEALLARAEGALAAAGAAPVARAPLAEGVACDFLFGADAKKHRDLRDAVCAALAGAPVDVVAQSAAGRRKRLLVADMDSTIIGQECIDEIADFAGKKAEVAAVTERAMQGALNFEAALEARLALLKGLSESVLERVWRERIRLNPGAEVLVRTMSRAGAATALVSGGFTYFTARVAAAAGFDIHEANELLVEKGALSGAVSPPIKGREAKEAALVRLAEERGVALAETMAVGDGANDLSMLGRAGIGVAYRAKPAVAAAADARIDHGDLTALLYMQGYRRQDFAGEDRA